MKQAISWKPLSANLLKLESSILPRAKRATNRNNVDTEKTNLKKKVLAPDSPGAEMSIAQTATPKRTQPLKYGREPLMLGVSDLSFKL